jgi:hypothetical protein
MSVRALDFGGDNITWSLTTSDGNKPGSPFSSVLQSNTATDSVLTFTLQPSTGYTNTVSLSANVTSSFFDNAGTTLNATWSGLSKLSDTSITPGTVSISITEAATSANMFSQSATSSPPDSPTIKGTDLNGVFYGDVQINVKFQFTSWSQPVSSSGLTFSLDFHN